MKPQMQRYMKPFYEHSEADVQTFLDMLYEVATEPANVPGFLMKFAVLEMLYESHNIDLFRDMVNMAHQLGKKINLAWSEARIEEEHDRLSRTITVNELKAENVTYKCCKELDSAFKDIRRITNSARLALEGKRQQHCIASYHKDLKSDTRIAVYSFVFQGKRWTMLCSRDQGGIRCGQVKGRQNSYPDEAVYEYIKSQFQGKGELHYAGAAGDGVLTRDVLMRAWGEMLTRPMPPMPPMPPIPTHIALDAGFHSRGVSRLHRNLDDA